MKTRVIICGGRDFSDRNFCFSQLRQLLASYENIEIVSGHAKGADTFGEEYAEENGLKVSVFKPDWKLYGRAAGPIRNRQMLEYAEEENPVVIAFWNGKSKGTENMIRQSERAGAEVHIVSYK